MIEPTGMKKSCRSAARVEQAAASGGNHLSIARVWNSFKDHKGTAAAGLMVVLAVAGVSVSCSSTDIGASRESQGSYSCDPNKCEAPGDKFSGDLAVGASVPVGQLTVGLKSLDNKAELKCGKVEVWDFCGKQVAEMDLSDGENKPVPNTAIDMNIGLSGIDVAKSKAHLDIVSACGGIR